MDFSKLDERDIDFFLTVYRKRIDIPYNDKIKEAEILFYQLKANPLSSYPYAVTDLYISKNALIDDKTEYTIKDISNLSDQDKERFAKLFYLDSKQDNFIQRLIRILGYLDLIKSNDEIIENKGNITKSIKTNKILLQHFFAGDGIPEYNLETFSNGEELISYLTEHINFDENVYDFFQANYMNDNIYEISFQYFYYESRMNYELVVIFNVGEELAKELEDKLNIF